MLIAVVLVAVVLAAVVLAAVVLAAVVLMTVILVAVGIGAIIAILPIVAIAVRARALAIELRLIAFAPLAPTIAIRLTIRLTILALTAFLFARQFTLRLAQHARVMFGMLQEILFRHTVIAQLGVARQLKVFVNDLLRRAANLALGTGAVENPIDDITDSALAVRLGTRTGFG